MKSNGLSQKRRFQVGFLSGLLAGIVATGVMLLVSILWNGISLPEVVGSALTSLMPPSLFNFFHQTIGGDAKYFFLLCIVVGQCLVFGLIGACYSLRFSPEGQHADPLPRPQESPAFSHRRKRRSRKGKSGNNLSTVKGHRPSSKPTQSKKRSILPQPLLAYQALLPEIVLIVGLWLLVGLVLLPLMGAGIFGTQLNIGLVNTMLSLAIVGVVFGRLFIYALNWLTARAQVREAAAKLVKKEPINANSSSVWSISRRTLLTRGAVLVGIGLVGVEVLRFIIEGVASPRAVMTHAIQNFKSKIIPPPIPNYGTVHPTEFLSPEITANDQYYVVSKNLVNDPVVNSNGWQLVVDGQVEHPFSLTYEQVRALPLKQQYESMMCISNEVGGQYMSNALWEGVPLMNLLQRAGVKAGATKVVFHAEDDYVDSIHLSKALEPTTLMAVNMNGVTLPKGHGFPARMLVPGIYGMKHCKWLKRIEVVNYDFKGYWQQRGWTDPAPIRMSARIDTPLDGANVSAKGSTSIAGVAFSGNKGISEVDVSTDGGQTWQLATLKRPLSDITWVLWQLEWQPSPGNYMIVARAIDLEGNVQDPMLAPPLPDGSTGYHTILANVA